MAYVAFAFWVLLVPTIVVALAAAVLSHVLGKRLASQSSPDWAAALPAIRDRLILVRFLAFVVDGQLAGLVLSALAAIILGAFALLRPHGPANLLLTLAFAVVLFLTLPIYFILSWAIAGATLGQRIAGVRVVELDGARPSWKRACVRGVVLIVSWVLFFPLAISVFVQRQGRALPDLLAGTVVIPRQWIIPTTGSASEL